VVIDAHQHVWDLESGTYTWLGPHYGPINRTFTAAELAPQLAGCGVDKTVLVQAADHAADTDRMLAVAEANEWVAGVVGWVPLDQPAEAERQLEQRQAHPSFVGVRALIHERVDPRWVMRPAVIDGLRVLAAQGVPFDLVAVLPEHLALVPELCDAVPDLRVVIDHLAKPPIATKAMEPWAGLLRRAAAASSNVYAKVSGLNTAAGADGWSAADLQPYVDHAVEVFGADRLMFGGDWPVLLLAGTYAQVVDATREVTAAYGPDAAREIMGDTAQRFYGLPVASGVPADA
jgi:L-fuconolactonase